MVEEYEFIHIPKCAGTSIRKAINWHKMGHNPVRKNNDIKDDTYVFGFVRNPFDRIASWYRWNYRRNIFSLKSDDIGFEDWFYLTLVQNKRPYYYNPDYLKSCYWYLSDEDGLRADFVGKVEQIDIDFAELCEILGISAILPVLNTTEKGDETYTEDMKQIMYDLYADDFNEWYPDDKPS